MEKEQISIAIRKLIVKGHQEGLSNRENARRYNVSEAGVRKILQKYWKHGTVSDLIGRGRKRKTIASDDRRIFREVAKNSSITSRAIRENTNLKICDRTVRRRLQEMGFKNEFAQRRPLIRNANRYVYSYPTLNLN